MNPAAILTIRSSISMLTSARRRRSITFAATAVFAVTTACAGPNDESQRTGAESMSTAGAENVVVEIATFRLKSGVSVEEFRPLDKAVELQHVSKQPGFISRESAAGDDSEWLVIVHWRSVADADASMASFANAPAAQEFMSRIDVSTMTMKRYTK